MVKPLENIGFLKNGIDVLAPGQERRQNQPSVADPFGDLSQLQVTIPVNYEDSRGTKYSEAFPLDFTEPDLLPTARRPLMNKCYFGNNLKILREIDDQRVHLICPNP